MKKTTLIILLVSIATLFSCKTNDNKGELVGVKYEKKFFPEKPYGMVLIPGGAFTMGKADEDIAGSFSTPARTVTVTPYFMDETEITNSEYREFVYRVRDSILRTKLAILAEEDSMGEEESLTGKGKKNYEGIQNFKFKEKDTTGNIYYRYMMENYGSLGDINSQTEGRYLNWDVDITWDTDDFPNMAYAEAMDSMYLPLEDALDTKRKIDTKKLKYTYLVFDTEDAIKKNENTREFLKKIEIAVYPDTTVWVKDFNYSYNDPMHQNYFWHQAYSEYPVVGVSWGQAKAFCDARSKKRNNYLLGKKNSSGREPNFRLPIEAEWEYAARGGVEYAKYPWGGPYTVSDRGCFLANFKPDRGNYALDGALYTVEAKSYNANDYGLYNMAGNVSEWTNTAYNPSSYKLGSTINPNVMDEANHRKVIRGGSWKDVAYFLEVGTRDYEYADTVRSYIGFRTVQDYLGTNKMSEKQ